MLLFTIRTARWYKSKYPARLPQRERLAQLAPAPSSPTPIQCTATRQAAKGEPGRSRARLMKKGRPVSQTALALNAA